MLQVRGEAQQRLGLAGRHEDLGLGERDGLRGPRPAERGPLGTRDAESAGGCGLLAYASPGSAAADRPARRPTRAAGVLRSGAGRATRRRPRADPAPTRAAADHDGDRDEQRWRPPPCAGQSQPKSASEARLESGTVRPVGHRPADARRQVGRRLGGQQAGQLRVGRPPAPAAAPRAPRRQAAHAARCASTPAGAGAPAATSVSASRYRSQAISASPPGPFAPGAAATSPSPPAAPGAAPPGHVVLLDRREHRHDPQLLRQRVHRLPHRAPQLRGAPPRPRPTPTGPARRSPPRPPAAAAAARRAGGRGRAGRPSAPATRGSGPGRAASAKARCARRKASWATSSASSRCRRTPSATRKARVDESATRSSNSRSRPPGSRLTGRGHRADPADDASSWSTSEPRRPDAAGPPGHRGAASPADSSSSGSSRPFG